MTTTKESLRVSQMDVRRNELHALQQAITEFANARKTLRDSMRAAVGMFSDSEMTFHEMMEVATELVELNQMFDDLVSEYQTKTLEQKAQKRVHREAVTQRRKSPVKYAYRQKRAEERYARFVAWQEKNKVAA